MKYWKISDFSLTVSENRIIIQQVFFSLAMVSLALNFWYHISIAQIGPNPLLYQDVDPVYLLFMYLGIPQFISGWPAPYFDAMLVISCIATIAWPRSRVFPILFFIFHFVYFILYNMLSGHHYISIGLLIMSFPFMFYSRSRFASMFTLCRLIFCFMMFSAACWKIVRGNLWHIDQTNMLLISTYADAFIANKTSVMVQVAKWLIHHRFFSHALWCILILLEGIFVVGLFTFRWDKILLAAYLLFFAGGWIIFNIYNYDNLLFVLTLVPTLQLIAKMKPIAEQ
jgi:hypothetical protein